MKTKFFTLLFILLTSNFVYAISLGDCVGTSSTSFPYIPDFGVSGNISLEKEYWYDTAITKNMKFWSFTTHGENNQIIPAMVAGSDADYESPTLFSRCLDLKTSDNLMLTFTLVTTANNIGKHFKVWLTPKESVTHFYFKSGSGGGPLLLDANNLGIGSYTFNIPIANIPADSLYAIAMQIEDCGWIGNIYIKDFKIEKISNIDNSLGKLVSPMSSCALNENEKVQFQVKNNGSTSINSIKAFYQINNGTITSETFPLNLGKGKDTTLCFLQRANLSSLGNFDFKVWLEKNPQDPNSTNDSILSKIVKHYSKTFTLPFSENFEVDSFYSYWNTLSKVYNRENSWNSSNANGNKVARIQSNADSVSEILLSPCLTLEANKTYQIKFLFKSNNALKPEKLKVLAGNNPYELNDIIWDLNNFTLTDFQGGTTYYTPATTSTYYFGWQANNAGFKSGVDIDIDNITITEITPYSIPYNQDFEHNTLENEISILDRNFDGNTWMIEESENNSYNSQKSLKISANSTQKSDDWVNFAPIYLEASKKYSLIYSVKGFNSSSEKYTLVLNNTPNINNTPILKITDSSNTSSYSLKNTTIEVNQSGNYYLSIQAILNAKAIGALFLDNIMWIDSSTINDTLIQLNSAVIPSGALSGSSNEYLEILCKSFLNKEIKNIKAYYKINSENAIMESFDLSLPYQSKEFFFNTPANFSKGGNFNIQFWINYPGQKDEVDTLFKSISVLAPANTPYFIDFENSENLSAWNFESNWELVNPSKLAYQGMGYANSPTQTIAQNGFLVSRGIVLSKDTTYLLNFFYSQDSLSSTSSNGSNLSVLYSNLGQNPAYFSTDSICLLKEFKNLSYKQKFKYFRVPSSGTYYFAFKSHSVAYTKGINLDEISFMDSLTSIKTELALLKVNGPLSTTCDIERNDIVSIEVQNNGYFETQNVVVNYNFGNGVLFYDTIPSITPGSIIKYNLKNHWIMNQVGRDSLKVWLSMPHELDRSNDSSSYIFLEKINSKELPLNYGFESSEKNANWLIVDLNGDNKTWNLSNNPSQAHSGSSFAQYSHQKGNITANDWLITNCFDLKNQENYEFEFHYKTSSTSASEKLEIYLLRTLHLDSLPKAQLLGSINNISNTSYSLYQNSFQANKDGRCYLGVKAASNSAGQELFVDDVKIRKFDTLWDAGITHIFNEYSSFQGKYTILDSNETLSVGVENFGNTDITKLPIVCEINGKIILRDTIASILKKQTISYTFRNKLNLYAPDSFAIKIYTLLNNDAVSENNHSQLTLVPSLPSIQINSLNTPISGILDSNEVLNFNYIYKDTLVAGKSIFNPTSFVYELNGGDKIESNPLVFSSNTETSYSFTDKMNLYAPISHTIKITPKYRGKELIQNSKIFTVICQDISVKIDSLISPNSGVLDSNEIVTIRLINHGEIDLHKVILVTKINQAITSYDTIATILAKDTLYYNLQKPMNLYKVGNYQISIAPYYKGTVLDLRGISKTIVSKAQDLSVRNINFPLNGVFDSTEKISCILQNIGEFDVKNFSLNLDINSQLHQKVIIPELKSGDTLLYTFDKPCNFYKIGAYPVKVFIESGKDVNPSNNSLNITIYSEAPDASIVAFTSPIKAPFSKNENISITVRNLGKYNMNDIHLVCKVNQNVQNGVLNQLNIGESKTFIFPNTVDMSINQDYNLLTFINTDKSANYFNDTISKKFSKIVSIDEEEIPHLNIYPNPTKDLINIDYLHNIIEVEILDRSGILALKIKPINAKTTSFSIAHLPKGLYILKIHSQKEIYSKTIILN